MIFGRASRRLEVAIVGAGHNALTCAAYLARAGHGVTLFEALPAAGGAIGDVGLSHGLRAPRAAHLNLGLHPAVAAELDLARHGLSYTASGVATVVLGEGGRHLRLDREAQAAAAGIARLSAADARRWPVFIGRMRGFGALLRELQGSPPPRLGSGHAGDRRALLQLGVRMRRLGRESLRELMRIAAMNVADLVEDVFETPLLQGALAFDAVLGTRLGPRSPGSVLTLLHRLAGETERGIAFPRGGPGAIADALLAAARAAGATLRCECPVARIEVRDDRAAGLTLASGERVHADCVVSGADPRQTFLELLGPAHLDTGFVRDVRNLRARGTVARLDLVLDGAPELAGGTRRDLLARLLIAPGVDDIEREFDHAKYGEPGEAPLIECCLPTLLDDTLGPRGRHLLSALLLYAPHDLRGGWDEAARQRLCERAMAALERHLPGLGARVLDRRLLTPVDFERELRMPGGHWHHGEIAFDQYLMLRPVPGAAQYATPLPGLYLCGAGAHPGGGINGAAGRNAARRLLTTEGER